MILGDPAQIPAAVAPGARMTLDDLFRRTTERSPQMIALIDPPNRASFTDGGLAGSTNERFVRGTVLAPVRARGVRATLPGFSKYCS